jgi:hypothetical protein
LELLLPFVTVKSLYLSKEFAPGIAAALQELFGAIITKVLPSLQNIFVEWLEPSGSFQENIEQFVAARQLSDHPITISVWEYISKMKRARATSIPRMLSLAALVSLVLNLVLLEKFS